MKISHRRSIQTALVVTAGAVAVCFLGRSRGDAVPSSAPAPARTSAPAQAVQASSSSASRDVAPGHSPVALAEPDDYEGHPLADVLHQVLASDHQLDTFMYYYNRPLLDDEAKLQYHALLSDPAVFASIEHDLLYPEESKADQAGSIKRLMKIDYLREALEWKGNPMRAELIALVSEMILTDVYTPGMAMDMRLSLSGDKMELYELLDQVAPDQAQALLQASRGTRLERLIAYINNNIEDRKQLVANAQNQVFPRAR